MSQTDSTINFLIHDANGKPQVVKVVQNSNTQAIPQIKLKSNPLKLIKLPGTQEGKGPIFKAVRLSNLKSIPNNKIIKVPSTQLFTPIAPKAEPGSPEEKNLLEVLKPKKQPKIVYPEVKVLEPFVNIAPGPAPELRVSSTSTSSAEHTPSTGQVTSSTRQRTISTREQPNSMSHGTRRRHDSENDVSVVYTTKRRKHADKVGKGLRHFSMKVCEKVRNKGFTSYNEVADELVLEFAAGMHGAGDSQQYDQKNIRRRVYDALNVLMAMNIISKEKKEIRWLGLPTNSVQECTSLEKEKQEKIDQIQKKQQQLQELILQHISFKSLIERNKDAESKGIKPSPSSAIHLPFIVVNTSDKALIDCSISNDKTEYMFNFNKRFQIHDDIDILKRMGLLFGLDKGECTVEDIERAKSMVPKSLETYVEQMAKGDLSNITAQLEEYEDEDDEEDDDTLEGDNENEQEDDPEEQDGNESSDDSSDVDV